MCSCQRTPPIRVAPEDATPGDSFRQIRYASGFRRAARLRMVGVTGVEPVTLRLSSACSNQLSYTPTSRIADSTDPLFHPTLHSLPHRRLVELRRLELLTYSLQSYRSTN